MPEVRQKLQAAAVEINDSSYVAPSRMTLGKWLEIWQAEYLLSQKYSTQKHYKAQIKAHLKPGLGNVRLDELAPHTIQTFYNRLLREGKTAAHTDEDGEKTTVKEPLSAKSVRNIHGILTKALSQAVDSGYMKSNPCDKVTLPRNEKPTITPLTDEQVKAYITSCDSDEYGALLKVILFTGLRESEALGLTWDDIDFDAGRITVRKQLQKRPLKDGGFQYTSLKNDKTRTIMPAPFVMTLLKDVKIAQMESRMRAAELWNGWKDENERKTAAVFTTQLGEHLHPQTVYNHHKKVAIAAGAPDACVHDLRHTFAVLSLQNGDDIKTVQGNLGHATAAFTLDVYGHVSERMQQASSERMQAYIENIK